MKNFRADQGGISPVIAMLMLLAIFVGFYAMWMTITVPGEFAMKEKIHMQEVRDSFADLQGAIQQMSVGEARSMAVPMSVELVSGTFRGPNIAGRLSARDNIITFDIQNAYYVPQSYVYENGAVILYQSLENQSVMVSDPPLVAVRSVEGDNIEVTLQTVRIQGSSEITTTGTATITATIENVVTSGSTNMEDVTIVVRSNYRDAWKDYLKKLAKELRDDDIDAVADLENMRITIYGKASAGVNDIAYIERYREVNVAIW